MTDIVRSTERRTRLIMYDLPRTKYRVFYFRNRKQENIHWPRRVQLTSRFTHAASLGPSETDKTRPSFGGGEQQGAAAAAAVVEQEREEGQGRRAIKRGTVQHGKR